MTNQQKEQITALRSQGYGYATIAKAVGLKKDTVVAFCRKMGMTGTKAADNRRIELDAGFCLQCGALLTQTPGMSEDKFRSEMSYLAALSIAKNLREKGLLSEEEYAVIDTNLRAEFSPSLGTLLSENDLI